MQRITLPNDGVSTPPYVLVTPARDEEENIARTIESVLAQTVRPRHWVIVDDGSTDRTGEIIRRSIAGESGVTLIERSKGRPADFASKARAFGAAVEVLRGFGYDFIGNLDADITVPRQYYEQLLGRFESRSGLGLAGGVVAVDAHGRVRNQRTSPTSVAGAVQFFRRQCFDDVGGLLPMRLGGIDSAAEILARMHGWEVATFFDMPVLHHGPVLNRKRNAASAWFSRGRVNHSLGYDPLFQAAVSLNRAVFNRPIIFGGALMFAGYLSAVARRERPALPAEAVAFLRREQRQRLRAFVRR